MMHIIKLYPYDNSLYHFGIAGLEETETIFHSDSLFSAIVNNYIKLFGEDDLEKFLNEAPVISSMFHFIESDESKSVLFLPKPLAEIYFFEEEPEDKKKIKKISYISFNTLNLWNRGGRLSNAEMNRYIINKKYLVCEEDLNRLGLESLRAVKEIEIVKRLKEIKVIVPRIQKENPLPYVEEHFYLNNNVIREKGKKIQLKTGFYFFVDNLKNDIIGKRFLQAVYLIKDEGLGGERSTGKGLFKRIVVKEDVIKEDNINSDTYMSLSLVSPAEKETKSLLYFDILERKGYVYSIFKSKEYRKRPVWMLREGSVFNSKVKGELKRVIDKEKDNFDHDVYKDGRALTIQIKVDKNEL